MGDLKDEFSELRKFPYAYMLVVRTREWRGRVSLFGPCRDAGRFHNVEICPQPRLSKTRSAGLDASLRLVGHGNLSYYALYFGLVK